MKKCLLCVGIVFFLPFNYLQAQIKRPTNGLVEPNKPSPVSPKKVTPAYTNNPATEVDPNDYTMQRGTKYPIMVKLDGGTFSMGSNGKLEYTSDEMPIHEVTVSPFYIGKYEVTYAQYDAFCMATRRKKPSDNGLRGYLPVGYVNRDDATDYCAWLSKKTGQTYRLPTEAEWEYAARGGENFTYSGSNDHKEVGWYSDNNNNAVHQVGQKKANGFGLYDMSGNVGEFCSDWYSADFYANSPTVNPKGPSSGKQIVYRGMDERIFAKRTRVSSRSWVQNWENCDNMVFGFRVVLQTK